MTMFRIALVILWWLSVASSVFCQTIADLKSCVTFIYIESKGQFKPYGTGFFLGIRDTTRDVEFVYVITAKHILLDKTTNSFPRYCWLRQKRVGGDLTFVRIPLTVVGPKQNVYVHSDTTVDIVAIGAALDAAKYDYTVLPYSVVRTGEGLKRLGIEEGVDILIPALFEAHLGEHENYPVIRSGKLALISGGERIKWDGQFQRLHLVESISIGGHSGAPVFAWFNPRVLPGNMLTSEYAEKRIRLIGVMQGYFGQERPQLLLYMNHTQGYLLLFLSTCYPRYSWVPKHQR